MSGLQNTALTPALLIQTRAGKVFVFLGTLMVGQRLFDVIEVVGGSLTRLGRITCLERIVKAGVLGEQRQPGITLLKNDLAIVENPRFRKSYIERIMWSMMILWLASMIAKWNSASSGGQRFHIAPKGDGVEQSLWIG